MFGDAHTRELVYQAEARRERRDFYAWKYSRPAPPAPAPDKEPF
jgi:hypothetical protein